MASVTEHAQWGVGCLPPLNVDKQAIAAAFSRAAESYDSAANLQRETGHRLVQLGQQHTGLWCWMRVVARGISASIGACWVSGSLPWIWRQVCWIMRANSRSLTTICWGILNIFHCLISRWISALAIWRCNGVQIWGRH